MKIKAYAKVNLMLDILGTLPNGYHNLWMIMQSVSLSDTVTVTENDSKEITITCSKEGIPTNEKNIAHKAARAFFEYTQTENCGIHIDIQKNIPSEAGLAGGSADGAAVIKALNELFKTKLSERELCRIGKKIGADVPFCIVGGTCLAQNIGEVVAPLEDIPNCYFVLAKPTMGVSTKEAYESFDNASYIRKPKREKMFTAAANGNFDKMCSLAANVFEQVIEVPERVEMKKIMRQSNAKLSLMSGSGPTVYGVFENENDAKECAEKLKKITKDVFIATPVTVGTEIIE